MQVAKQQIEAKAAEIEQKKEAAKNQTNVASEEIHKEAEKLKSINKLQRPAIVLTSATHARELITIQYTLYQMLNILHGSLVRKEPKFRNLLAQNKYYVIPIINPDGLAMIEHAYEDSHEILKKRKNMSPNAARSGDKSDYPCAPEDSGVDLNRNWAVDFNVSDSQY